MIVHFFQRYASFFAIFAGLLAYRLILPKDSPWWLELPLGLVVTIAVYLLLHKDGVTQNRRGRGGK